MKQFITIVILWFVIFSCGDRKCASKDFIRIEHNGPSDKLIKVIVISVGKIPKSVEWENNFAVSCSQFSSIEKFVFNEMENNLLDRGSSPNEWAVFKITIFVSDSTKVYQLRSQADSYAFFTNLSNFLTHDKGLPSQQLKAEVDNISNLIKP
jgi:hypothetical protein